MAIAKAIPGTRIAPSADQDHVPANVSPERSVTSPAAGGSPPVRCPSASELPASAGLDPFMLVADRSWLAALAGRPSLVFAASDMLAISLAITSAEGILVSSCA